MQIEWDTTGERYFEAGVDKGVLYPKTGPGVPWIGLISVTESPSGGEAKPFYVDGNKYLNLPSMEEFQGTIEAFTYPDEFALCDGTAAIGDGLFISQQPRQPFSLSYRTKIGNDLEGLDHGYKLHLIYNALVSPSSKSFTSIGETVDPLSFSWGFTTTPVIFGPSLRPTAHVIIDSRKVNASVLQRIENTLYGTLTEDPKIIPLGSLLSYFPTLKVIDNGDGTWTALGTDYEIQLLSEEQFKITSEGASYLDEDSYTLRSVED